MRPDRFNELAEKFNTFYLNYKKANAPGKTYIVATTDFNTPYIQSILEKSSDRIKAILKSPQDNDELVVFSYSNNSFRTLKYDQVVRLSMLSVELDKEERNAKRKLRRA